MNSADQLNNIKKSKKYDCKTCSFSCNKNNEWTRHLVTRKHINLSSETKSAPVLISFTCKICNKEYKSRHGLGYHIINCKEKTVELTDSITTTSAEPLMDASGVRSMILEFLTEINKQNNELHKQHNELQVKVMTEMQTQFMEMFQKIQSPLNTTINHNQNSHNKTTFNMQVFLNEHCKDAMNLKDFVDSIQLTLADLDSVGERGFVEGISKIITNNLRKTDVHLRPIHCSDVKREVMYVKENNKWEKDSPQNDMIRDCIKKVEHKNIRLLIDYCLVHPDCTEPDSPYNDQYLKLTSTSTSGTDTMLDKIITRIANEVVVEKK
jgi:hypothetical protein